MSKLPTLSIVIPVFNEASNIVGCLESIATQRVLPDEVIIVDNNCTDKTIALAKRYPFVKIIVESRQGRGWARTAGFNAVSCELIGRIDADSRLAPDWAEKVKQRFAEDAELAGVTGPGHTSFIPWLPSLTTKMFTKSYFWYVHARFLTITMWGANMAISTAWWQRIRDDVTNDDSIVHEDQDISLVLAGAGGKILQDNTLLITTDGQAYRYLPKFIEYRRLLKGTLRLHKMRGNLQNDKPYRLTRLGTLPGLLASLPPATVLFFACVLSYPFDLLLQKRTKSTK